METFDYLVPETLSEAVKLVSQYGPRAKVLAGGTDLIIDMREELEQPECVIDLKHIRDLAGISDDGSHFTIGALTTIREIETSPVIKQAFPVLSYAASKLGSVQVRNKATLGGNLCHAIPSADTAPALIALSASVKYVGHDGEKTCSLEDFFKGPGKTVLANEILTHIVIPKAPAYTAAKYIKFTVRKAMDLAIVGVASLVTTDASASMFKDIRIVLGAVAPTPMRAKQAEAILRGNQITAENIAQAAKLAAQEAQPRSTSIRASEWYKRKLVAVLTRRSINQALVAIRS